MKYEDANVAAAPERDDTQHGEDANMVAVPERPNKMTSSRAKTPT